jgi:hypothetical protein
VGQALAGGAGADHPGSAGELHPPTHPATQPPTNLPRCRPGRAREIPMSRVVCPAGPVRFSEYFHASCCFSSSCSRFRGRVVLVSPRLAVSYRAAAHCPQSTYEAESVMPRYRPSDTVGRWVPRGLRSVLIRHILSHDTMSRIVTCFFFWKKLEKLRSCFVIFCHES